jgi:hypothetical protein
MKHFSICLFMLLLLVLGKHNGARLTPADPLAQRVGSPRPAPLPRMPLRLPAAGAAPRVAALVAR